MVERKCSPESHWKNIKFLHLVRVNIGNKHRTMYVWHVVATTIKSHVHTLILNHHYIDLKNLFFSLVVISWDKQKISEPHRFHSLPPSIPSHDSMSKRTIVTEGRDQGVKGRHVGRWFQVQALPSPVLAFRASIIGLVARLRSVASPSQHMMSMNQVVGLKFKPNSLAE